MSVNMNHCVFIGRMTRDPEVSSLQNGTRLAKFGFATNNRKKDRQTGEWVDDPMFLDVEAFGRTADAVDAYGQKGSLIALEGRLIFEQWEDRSSGQKRSKHKLIAESVQVIDGRKERAEQTERTAKSDPRRQQPAEDDPDGFPF